MDIDDILKKTLEDLLKRIGFEYSKIVINEEEKENYSINIESNNPSLLIGYHGENIHALQHLLKVLIWKKTNNETFTITLDIDDYKKRQEENILSIAKRKIETARKTGRAQHLPPMSAYLRRKIHTLCMGVEYDDIETSSEGEGEDRHVIIKLKS